MSFGLDTDVIGFASTANKYVSHTKSRKVTEGQTMDSNGDIFESVARDTIFEHTFGYNHVSDTALDLYSTDTTSPKDFRLGKVIGGLVITAVEVATANNERPTVTITAETCTMADTAVRKYTTADLNIAGTRTATKLGATVAANNKLISMTAKASVTVVRALDSAANTAALQVHGGRIEATSNFVGTGAAASATSDTGWLKTDGPGQDAKNTDYQTGSITVIKNLAKM
jgi:hypothetical protein